VKSIDTKCFLIGAVLGCLQPADLVVGEGSGVWSAERGSEPLRR
jgi:hypothetical protein